MTEVVVDDGGGGGSDVSDWMSRSPIQGSAR